jgi:hypothetical protein
VSSDAKSNSFSSFLATQHRRAPPGIPARPASPLVGSSPPPPSLHQLQQPQPVVGASPRLAVSSPPASAQQQPGSPTATATLSLYQQQPLQNTAPAIGTKSLSARRLSPQVALGTARGVNRSSSVAGLTPTNPAPLVSTSLNALRPVFPKAKGPPPVPPASRKPRPSPTVSTASGTGMTGGGGPTASVPVVSSSSSSSSLSSASLSSSSGVTPASPSPASPADTPANPTYGVATALYDFIPEASDELRLNRGDKVTLRERIDENWWEGELRGQVGIFPTNYVQVITPPAS